MSVESDYRTAQDLCKLLADLAEDLAIEILSEATEEDYLALGTVGDHLIQTSEALSQHGVDLPFPVTEVLRNLYLVNSRH